MKKFKYSRFSMDAFVSPSKYKAACVLQEVLEETDDSPSAKWVNKLLNDFNYQLNAIKEISPEKQKVRVFLAILLLRHFVEIIKKAEHRPEMVRSLLRNIMKTKYKLDILGKESKY